MTNNEVKSAGTLVYRYVHLPKSRQTQSHEERDVCHTLKKHRTKKLAGRMTDTVNV